MNKTLTALACAALLCGCAHHRTSSPRDYKNLEVLTEIVPVGLEPSSYSLKVTLRQKEKSQRMQGQEVLTFPALEAKAGSQQPTYLSTSNHNNQIIFVPHRLMPNRSGVELEFRVSEANKQNLIEYKVSYIDSLNTVSNITIGRVFVPENQ